jgi:SAM-dependent methyltransferase
MVRAPARQLPDRHCVARLDWHDSIGTAVRTDTREDAWEALAAADPLWAVYVRPRTRGRRWDLEDFLGTGSAEVGWVVDLLRGRGRMPAQRRLAVDFGSGVGRLAVPLCDHFDRVVGVDPSPTMRSLAAGIAGERPCSFVADLDGVDDAAADLVLSSLVLQHLTADQLPSVFAGIRRVLADDGIAVLQYPRAPGRTLRGAGFRLLPAAVIDRLQTRVLRYPAPMRMSWMAPARVAGLLAARELRAEVVTDGWQHSRHWKDFWYLAGPTRS